MSRSATLLIQLVTWLLMPALALPAAVPPVSPPAQPAPPASVTPEDIRQLRAACEQGGEFHEEVPVTTPEKKGFLNCRAAYEGIGLPIPAAKVTAQAQPSRMDLESCIPPDPVGDLMPKVEGEDVFGKIGQEEDEEACRKAAEENRGTLLGDLGCMVVRDLLRGVAVVPGASAAGGAISAGGAAATTASIAGGAASGAIGGEGLLGVAEWIANKIQPDQSCVTTKKSSCVSAAIAGVVNNLLFNIKGIWSLIKLPFQAIGSLFSKSAPVEDAMADKKLEASQSTPEEAAGFFSDPAAWLKRKVAELWESIKHEVTHNYGCREWSGSATFGQMGAGTCVKPWVCFEAASADQVLSAACGVLGFAGGEALSAYLTGGATGWAKTGMTAANTAIKAGKLGGTAIKVAAVAEKAAISFGEKVTTGVMAVANFPGIRGMIGLALLPAKVPLFKDYIRFVGAAFEAGETAALGSGARLLENAGKLTAEVTHAERAADAAAEATQSADALKAAVDAEKAARDAFNAGKRTADAPALKTAADNAAKALLVARAEHLAKVATAARMAENALVAESAQLTQAADAADKAATEAVKAAKDARAARAAGAPGAPSDTEISELRAKAADAFRAKKAARAAADAKAKEVVTATAKTQAAEKARLVAASRAKLTGSATTTASAGGVTGAGGATTAGGATGAAATDATTLRLAGEDLVIDGTPEAKAAVAEAVERVNKLNLQRVRYGARSRKWSYGAGYAESRAAARAAEIEEIAKGIRDKYGVEVNPWKLRAEASLKNAMSELQKGVKGARLTAVDPAVDKKLAALQEKYDKLVAKIGPYDSAAKAKKIEAYNVAWKQLNQINSEIDGLVGAPGVFQDFNLARYHYAGETALADPRAVAKLLKDGSWGLASAEADLLETHTRFLNAQRIRFEVVGEKGARELRLIDDAGKPIAGDSFKIRDTLKACP